MDFLSFCRLTVNREIASRYNQQFQSLKYFLHALDHVSLTLDIWSDRKMRSYLGVTVHFLEDGQLESALLSCDRFKGVLKPVLKSHSHFQTPTMYSNAVEKSYKVNFHECGGLAIHTS